MPVITAPKRLASKLVAMSFKACLLAFTGCDLVRRSFRHGPGVPGYA
jgi:hypothetical protein